MDSRLRPVGLAVLLTATLAVPALAARAGGRVDCAPEGGVCATDVTFFAAPGEANDVSVTVSRNGDAVTLLDSAPITPGAPCDAVPDGAGAVQCRAARHGDDGDLTLKLLLGDADDRLRLRTTGSAVLIGLTVHGGDGNDDLEVPSGGLDGGPGDDRLAGGDVTYARRTEPVTADLAAGRGGAAGEVDTLVGVGGLFGGHAGDVLTGDGSANFLEGGAGADRIDGAGGSDPFVIGGKGNDRLDGGAGRDHVFGGPGSDRALGGPGDDLVDGERGNDRLSGGPGDDALDGGPGSDRVVGGAGDDLISGGTGRDRLIGGAGDDVIYARFDFESDTPLDSAAPDRGADELPGGGRPLRSGPHFYSGGPGNDYIDSANGRREIVSCGSGRDSVDADREDVLRGCERGGRG